MQYLVLVYCIIMEEEENISLCERILADLENIFKRDGNILEFDIVGEGDSTCNKSPVVYIDHHLGLEKWCVPHLYKYAYEKVLQFKLNIQRADLYLIHQWTRILLLINPDLTTAWNLRREIISNDIQTYLDDLKLTELILIRKPKSANVFTYREWLLNGSYQLNNDLNDELIDSELRVTLDASSRYPRNYYAWSHRTWIFTIFIAKSDLNYIKGKILDDLILTEKWIECHISDYSCFRHRQCLFSCLFTLESKFSSLNLSFSKSHMSKDLFWKEFQLLNSLFLLYPEQESLFLHRRFLLHAAIHWCPDQLDLLKKSEIDFFRNHILPILQKGCHYSWKNELVKRYLTYLKRNLNWSFES